MGKGKVHLSKIDGIAYKGGVNKKTKFMRNLDELPFPAVDLLPLENYWKLGFAHGPVKGKYLFLITSRGCPFNCNFCAAPAIWQRKWRPRSAKNIVDEMQENIAKFGIEEFHIQDDNFTFNKKRVRKFCNELLKRKIEVSWKLVAGIKVETIDVDTLELMGKAGCEYISISPETGSKRVLKLMNKPFDYGHALKIVEAANRFGIVSQICFVLGYPGEKGEDRKLTQSYIGELARAGADELGLFIMTPLPGAAAACEFGDLDYDRLNFSPNWRQDYGTLARARWTLYAYFTFFQFLRYPEKFIRSMKNIITGKFETKSEMALKRMLRS